MTPTVLLSAFEAFSPPAHFTEQSFPNLAGLFMYVVLVNALHDADPLAEAEQPKTFRLTVVKTACALYKMQQPNRLGLGLRPPLPSYGQGPSISALAQQQQQMHQLFVPPQGPPKQTSLFVGSISGGITDTFLNQLLTVSHGLAPLSPSYLTNK